MCKCVQEFVTDRDRFARENAAAYEEAKVKYNGCGFAPMRFVKPPKPLPSACEQHYPEALSLRERHSHHETQGEECHPFAVTRKPRQLTA